VDDDRAGCLLTGQLLTEPPPPPPHALWHPARHIVPCRSRALSRGACGHDDGIGGAGGGVGGGAGAVAAVADGGDGAGRGSGASPAAWLARPSPQPRKSKIGVFEQADRLCASHNVNRSYRDSRSCPFSRFQLQAILRSSTCSYLGTSTVLRVRSLLGVSKYVRIQRNCIVRIYCVRGCCMYSGPGRTAARRRPW